MVQVVLELRQRHRCGKCYMIINLRSRDIETLSILLATISVC